jgi:hypothetical protein
MSDPNDLLLAVLKRNQPYVKSGQHQYDTNLGLSEPDFRYWIAQNKVPFDSNATSTDYDMRGFYQALTSGDPHAQSAINPNDKRMHYPDYWKTPMHETFSSESQWAGPTAPQWNQKDQLISPGGRILKDERNPYPQLGTILSALR